VVFISRTLLEIVVILVVILPWGESLFGKMTLALVLFFTLLFEFSEINFWSRFSNIKILAKFSNITFLYICAFTILLFSALHKAFGSWNYAILAFLLSYFTAYLLSLIVIGVVNKWQTARTFVVR